LSVHAQNAAEKLGEVSEARVAPGTAPVQEACLDTADVLVEMNRKRFD